MRLSEGSTTKIQSQLLRGETKKAVESAMEAGHYELALLTASMCSRETYYSVAKKLCDEVLVQGTPLHTCMVLSSAQFAADQAGVQSPSLFKTSEDLRLQWRKHLAAIVRLQTGGWEAAAMSLGDRLMEIKQIAPAHFCYMVGGASISRPFRKGSKVSLLGCDVTLPESLLLSDNSVESFCRDEAFEWAKRRGNSLATIPSVQFLKFQYAYILCDLGFTEEARRYLHNISSCLGGGGGQQHRLTPENRVQPLFLLAFMSQSDLLDHTYRLGQRLGDRTIEQIPIFGRPTTFGTKSTELQPLTLPKDTIPLQKAQSELNAPACNIPTTGGNQNPVQPKDRNIGKQLPIAKLPTNPIEQEPTLARNSDLAVGAGALKGEPHGVIKANAMSTATEKDTTRMTRKKPESAPMSAPANLQTPSKGM